MTATLAYYSAPSGIRPLFRAAWTGYTGLVRHDQHEITVVLPMHVKHVHCRKTG